VNLLSIMHGIKDTKYRSEKCQSKFIGRKNIRSLYSHSHGSYKLFCTYSSCWVVHPCKENTHPILPASLNSFQVSGCQN